MNKVFDIVKVVVLVVFAGYDEESFHLNKEI